MAISETNRGSHQGYNSLAIGDFADAQDSFIAVLRLARDGGYLPFALEALTGIAGLQARQGDKEQALELLLIVLNHPASIQETRDRAGHLRTELETQLTGQQVKAVQEQARVKTFETAVDEVLKQV